IVLLPAPETPMTTRIVGSASRCRSLGALLTSIFGSGDTARFLLAGFAFSRSPATPDGRRTGSASRKGGVPHSSALGASESACKEPRSGLQEEPPARSPPPLSSGLHLNRPRCR